MEKKGFSARSRCVRETAETAGRDAYEVQDAAAPARQQRQEQPHRQERAEIADDVRQPPVEASPAERRARRAFSPFRRENKPQEERTLSPRRPPQELFYISRQIRAQKAPPKRTGPQIYRALTAR